MATAMRPTNKREAVMAAALELFVERGFFGTAVPEIADKAGVGAGTIYRYFASKEVLVNEIYRAEKMRWGQVLVGSVSSTTARELFRSLWLRMARFTVENQQSFVFMELHHHARYLDAESRALEQRMLDLFANVITAAQARGELKTAPPRLLMAIVMGAFIGVVRDSIERQQAITEDEWKLAEQCGWEAIRA
jgi:AcrR family transcriptional regulator